MSHERLRLVLNVEAAAQARAEPEPWGPLAQGSGLKVYEPGPPKPEPKPGLSGRAGPAHH